MEIQDAIDRLDDADRIWGADRRGPVGELFAALEEVEAMVASAKSVPATNQVRVNRDKFYEPLDRIRALLAKAAVRAGGASSPWAPVVEAVEGIEGLMDDAGHALFSRRLKIEARELRDVAARIRLAATQNLGPHDGVAGPKFILYAALDELDALAQGEGTLKLSFVELHGLLDRMRTAGLDGAG